MNRLKQLEVFVSIIELGSFAAAANKLCLTSPALSKQIKTLEGSLGIELIKRNTRNVALTEIGERYFEEAKLILAQLYKMDDVIHQAQTEPSGHLKVLSARYFAEFFILPNLFQFLHRYPKLILNLELAERIPDLIREEIDVFTGVSIEAYSGFEKQVLGKTRYVFCASPAYLEQYGIPAAPADLKAHRYITHSMRDKPSFVSFKNHPDVYVDPYLWLNDSKAMLEAAIQGVGITKLHHYFVATALAKGELIEIFPQYVEAEIPVYLYYRKGRYADPKVRAFLNFINTRIYDQF